MTSEAPSWADQWGTGGIGEMPEEDNTKSADGKKSGNTKSKIVDFISFKWMKNLVPKKKKTKDSDS
ncbi:unnamed protein product [Eruca vesicaria subsp. sativa]|uniref:Uncharacterized protein n=1 Tax=Eruca vesicaria subsp. sativa TaxID=29727 RepID=A0ABC8KA19_ERUVS|nr:unnamed protein product [Eruca vesicaria subsp. sativa]